MAKEEKKGLGRNCSFSEMERAAIVKAIDAVVDGGVKGWTWVLALKSAKEKVDFSVEEMGILKARERKPAAPPAPKSPLKKVK